MTKRKGNTKGSRPAPVFTHPPEVESKRETYWNIVEALTFLFKTQSKNLDLLLDYITDAEGIDGKVTPAILTHLANVWELVNWFTPEGQRLYVEIRLLADAQDKEGRGRL